MFQTGKVRCTARALLVAAAICASSVSVLLPAARAQGMENTQPQPQLHLPLSKVTIGGKTIRVQTARSPLETEKGLMFRSQLPADEGMLFDFTSSDKRCFWMRNTLLPLSAAFIASDGRILNIVDMQPLSEQSHCSAGAARYVLEMHQGWYHKNKIKTGMIATIALPES